MIASGGSITQAGLFTAGTAAGTYINTVQASKEGIRAFGTVTVTAGPLASVTVTPNPATMAINGTQQFTATGRDASGNTVAITPTWSVVAGGGAINTTGLFTAGTVPGTYTNTVNATSGAFSGTATAIVTAGALSAITVTPNPASMGINAAQQFTATGVDASGNTVVISPTWTVVNGGGAISSAGLFTAGIVPGTYTNTVRAAVGSVAVLATDYTIHVERDPGAGVTKA